MCVHVKIFYYPSKKNRYVIYSIFNSIYSSTRHNLSLTLSIDLRIIARIYVGGADVLVRIISACKKTWHVKHLIFSIAVLVLIFYKNNFANNYIINY